MNSIVRKYMERCAYTVLFLSTLSLSFHLFNSIYKFIDVQKEVVFDRGDGVMMVSNDFEENENIYVSYEELVSTLMNKIEFDMSIDGVMVKADTYSPYLFDFDLIPKKSYFIKTYIYDESGNVKQIKFMNY